MGFKIGMDFGTTNSTVAYINNDTRNPLAFKYPPVEGYEYIPSCVAYHDDDHIAIGRAAFDFAGAEDAVFCSNLKMILPMSPEQQTMYGWTKQKTPEETITDYFHQILTLRGEQSASFAQQLGEIEGIVLSVPHVWAKDPSHTGRNALKDIVENRLKQPLIQLISEPVAAAAYFAYQHQRQGRGGFTGNLLVCDMGGGTFDVTLCRIQPGIIEELFNDGNGRFNLGKAGVQFDTQLLKSKNLVENTYEFYTAYKELQQFKSHQPYHEIAQLINNAIEHPDLKLRTIYRAGRYQFNYEDIELAFREIRNGIKKVLQRVRQGIDQQGLKVDGLFFVGGFSQFILVRETIKNFWKIGQNDQRLIADINNEISRYAIAYGAALVANEMVIVEEKFEHTIGVRGVRRVERAPGIYEQEDVLIPIINGGRKLSEYEMPVFARDGERDVEVTAHQRDPVVDIFVDPSSINRPIIKTLPQNIELHYADIPGNRWKLGMRINRSKIVYLIFEDLHNHERREYELGDIIRQMFNTLVLEE